MIERKTALEQPELHRSGILGIKIAKLLVDNGVEIDCQWHRTSIEAGADVNAQICAVNAHLEVMGYPALSQADVDFIISCRAILDSRMAEPQ